MSEEGYVPYASYKGGPVNYGNPDDTYISDGERGSLLSKFIQEKLMTDLCRTEWKAWHRCLTKNKDKWFFVHRCRGDFKQINECQNKYIMDPEQMRKFEEEYLKIRSEFRRTGIGRPVLSKETIRAFMAD
ncbi:hypothetical protein EG68_10727 [Paragonimus skrjabini miyazakii]|uniref:COX assembly mitochondrial protein n=1 Tax=Paragonimus skrjabini miyazakii TaxID=59628 RepID=A0A8S9Y8N5_9TREM|nr:hypothetical protein EG68_10727 [Paragonimus skrjabini miyazakii]